MHLSGTLKSRPFGPFTEIFLGDATVPLLAFLQSKAREMHKPKATLVLSGLKFEGELDVENQLRAAHLRECESPDLVRERRLRVGEWDVLSYLRDGVSIDLRLH